MKVHDVPAGGGGGLRVQLLGGFRVYVDGRLVEEAEWRLRKAKNLVKLLALAPEHRLHREQVLDLLWPDLEPEAAANNLYKVLHVARHALEPQLAPGTPSAYLRLQGDFLCLQPRGPLGIDVEAFEAAAAAAQRTRDPAAYQTAVKLYSGDLLPEDRFEDWAARRREGLRGRYIGLLVELARLREAQGEHVPAMMALEWAVASDPACGLTTAACRPRRRARVARRSAGRAVCGARWAGPARRRGWRGQEPPCR